MDDCDATVHTAVVGLCWGDEGKGKIVDLLGPDFDYVIRYNGGANAGHTVCVGDDTLALHLVPSGALHENAVGVLGPGVAVDPIILIEEIDGLTAKGIDVADRLIISDRAHVVAPYHKIEDRLAEQAAGRSDKIGTTIRGIGPCYADKMHRSTAIRMCDLVDTVQLGKRVFQIVERKRRMFESLYGQDGVLTADEVHEQLSHAGARLAPLIRDTSVELENALAAGKRLLFEGANGMMLDVDHGTYPFVTSSSTGPCGIAAGAGVPPRTVGRVIGVTKAYATRVGSGPFPSELNDSVGDRIREQGREYGTTTGRPRRCGWLDAAALRSTIRLGGVTEVALMHLDTLSGLDRLGICTGYRLSGRPLDRLPSDPTAQERLEPVLEMHPGWQQDLRGCSTIDDLPREAAAYVDRVQELIECPIRLVSVGPDRAQTLYLASAAGMYADTTKTVQ